MDLPDGLVAIVKRDCPTCVTIAPVLAQLSAAGAPLTVYSQDDPSFPDGVPGVVDDRDLSVSYALDLTTVPTLLQSWFDHAMVPSGCRATIQFSVP